MKLVFKISVVIAVLVLLYNTSYKNFIVISQPKEDTGTGGMLTGDRSYHEVHSPSTNEARKTQLVQDEICSYFCTIRNREHTVQTWLNETNCFVVQNNRTIPHRPLASAQLQYVEEVGVSLCRNCSGCNLRDEASIVIHLSSLNCKTNWQDCRIKVASRSARNIEFKSCDI